MRKKLNAILNIIIAALSVTAVFAVFTALEFETADESPVTMGTSLIVISEPPPLETNESALETTLPPSETLAQKSETTAPISIPKTQILPVMASTRIKTDNVAAALEDVKPYDITSAETSETTAAETTSAPKIKTTEKTTTTAKTTTAADLQLHEETELPENQLYEEYEEEQSIIEVTMPTFTTPPQTTPATTIFIASDTTPQTSTPQTAPPSDSSSFTARVNGSRQTINAFHLVCGVVYNEVGDSFEDEAIKAQAVAAYSYLKYYEQNGDTPSVSADFDYPERIKNLVASVWGQACYHNGAYAQTVYSASSGGYTASAENVWGGRIPYLVSVNTPHDIASDPNYGIKKTISPETVKNALERSLNITLSDNPANWLTVASRIDGNYVDTVYVDGKTTISGRDLREDIMNYNIRSAAFDVSFDGQNFIFTTYGYGHGVGMSQNGANILAKQGYSYTDILRFYYTGVEIR
ncbi:MAG: SpoIID/LytB domain-containing protein [Ruminococcus sp.]|nr:SpoIID/LytB domain-containing protein [Ruminococcus sp.]